MKNKDKALQEIARRNLEEFERQADEAFLVRAELDRILSQFG